MDDDRTSNDVILELGPETPHTTSNRNLLESGMFADVVVRLRDRTIKCHRALLCAHSEWFREKLVDSSLVGRCFTPPFEGQKPGMLTFSLKGRESPTWSYIHVPDNLDIGELQLIIEFIYASRVNLRAFFGREYLLESIIRVWKLARYFRIYSLESLALDASHNALIHWIKTYGRHVREKTLADFPISMIEHLTDAIAVLYEDDGAEAKAAFRSPLLATALCGIHTIRTSVHLDNLLDWSREFAADWARVLMHRWSEAPQPPDAAPYAARGQQQELLGDLAPHVPEGGLACARCQRGFDEVGSQRYPNLLRWAKREMYEELCSFCLPDPTLDEWEDA